MILLLLQKRGCHWSQRQGRSIWLNAWFVLAFLFLPGLQGVGGAEGSGCLIPLHWFTSVISFIRSWHPSSHCKAIANRPRNAAFKSISMLSWGCVYDMSCHPPFFSTSPPLPLVLKTPLPFFHSRVVEQDLGEIIELQLWNRLNSVSTEQRGAAAAGHQAGQHSPLSSLEEERWSGEQQGRRGLWELPLHY